MCGASDAANRRVQLPVRFQAFYAPLLRPKNPAASAAALMSAAAPPQTVPPSSGAPYASEKALPAGEAPLSAYQ